MHQIFHRFTLNPGLCVVLFVFFSYTTMKEKLLNVLDDSSHRVIISTGGVSMGEKVSRLYFLYPSLQKMLKSNPGGVKRAFFVKSAFKMQC